MLGLASGSKGEKGIGDHWPSFLKPVYRINNSFFIERENTRKFHCGANVFYNVIKNKPRK